MSCFFESLFQKGCVGGAGLKCSSFSVFCWVWRSGIAVLSPQTLECFLPHAQCRK